MPAIKLNPEGRTITPRSRYPLFYLSGRFDTGGGVGKKEEDWLKRSGCKARCWSYAFVCPGGFYYRDGVWDAYQTTVEKKIHILMDSSAHSMHEFLRRGKVEQHEQFREKTFKGYVDFIKKDRRYWDAYINFDYRIHAPTVYKMQKRLEKLGLHPIPVFHGDDGMDWLRRYIDDGHNLIGIGGAKNIRRTWEQRRFYLDQVFNMTEKAGVMCHGLAFTSLSLAFCYPWYSVDSSTWARFSAYGVVLIMEPESHRLGPIHISPEYMAKKKGSYNDMPPRIQKEIRRQIEESGFDFDKVRHDHSERMVYNAWVYNHLAELGVAAGGVGKVPWERLF